MSRYFPIKKITSKVIIRSDTSASFYNVFNNISEQDTLYTFLEQLATEHKELCRVDVFKYSFNKDFMYFKKEMRECLDANGKPCLIDDLLDRECTAYITVQPYDFTSNKIRITGLTIRIQKLKLNKV